MRGTSHATSTIGLLLKTHNKGMGRDAHSAALHARSSCLAIDGRGKGFEGRRTRWTGPGATQGGLDLDVRVHTAVIATILSACSPSGESAPSPALSSFAADALIVGRVLENTTACVVDAVCYLEVQFADTTVTVVYGTGERPAPTCSAQAGSVDGAFEVEPGDVIDVIVGECGGLGYILRQLELAQ